MANKENHNVDNKKEEWDWSNLHKTISLIIPKGLRKSHLRLMGMEEYGVLYIENAVGDYVAGWNLATNERVIIPKKNILTVNQKVKPEDKKVKNEKGIKKVSSVLSSIFSRMQYNTDRSILSFLLETETIKRGDYDRIRTLIENNVEVIEITKSEIGG